MKRSIVFVALLSALCVGSFARTESEGGQAAQRKNTPAHVKPGITSSELAQFDEFLDAHKQIRVDLIKDPKLIDSENYILNHPELADFLHNHPALRAQILHEPKEFMDRERAYQKREWQTGGDITIGELGQLDQFLDAHRQIRVDLIKDPKLIDSENYILNHPELADFLHNHPALRAQILHEPKEFMDRERAYVKEETGGNITGSEVAQFDEFLGAGHQQIRSDLIKDPKLIDNKNYLHNHPDLENFLHNHPALRAQILTEPKVFMDRERAYEKNH